jgi:uncharacterized protein YllA (UPF0747 family)
MTLRVPLDCYPGINRFVLDWLRGDPTATRFLPREAPTTTRPPRVASLHRKSIVPALAESNRRWGVFVDQQLEQWASGQTVTIVGGQQVGFAGGPLYTLAKIATLVKMKRDMERDGTPVTAMFWLATEDHDYAEVAQLCVPVRTISREVNRQLDLVCVRAARAFESKTAVGRPGITFSDSFAELVAGIFGSEVVLVDSLLPELRRAGAPLFQSIFDRWSGIESAITSRSADLMRSGYSPQVVPPREGDSYSLLFELDDRFERHLIDRPRPVPPERISTSALTRPLLQDFALRPDVFVGGPAEVSYYAQIRPLHELLDVPLPRVALRGHALVAPKRMLRFIERFSIRTEDIFTSPDQLLAGREPESVDAIRREADRARKELMRHIEHIGEMALPAEHALARAINRSIGHIEYHFNKLTERAIRGLVRKDKERYAAAKELVATLYPDRHVQDRIVGWFPYWHQHGSELVDRMIDEIEPDAATFNIIGL